MDRINKISLIIEWFDANFSKSELINRLHYFGSMLPTSLSQRVNLDDYSDKLLKHAEIGFARIGNTVAGMVVMYANDLNTRVGHIPMLAVGPEFRRQGVGRALISRALARARQRRMGSVNLWVVSTNQNALGLYRSFRFRAVDSVEDRIFMQVELPLPIESKLLPQTPLECRPDLAAAFEIDIDLRVKRDDLYPILGGGSKARKISYILSATVEGEHDVIVTNGSPHSNHVRVAAIEAARLGIKCHIVIVTESKHRCGDFSNFLLTRLSGATIEYCTKERLSETMNRAVSFYTCQGHNPQYIWGGGRSLEGTTAFVDAAAEVRTQCNDWVPDFVVVASGTGCTQAGLAIGFADLKTRVLGISVAREAKLGVPAVKKCIDEYQSIRGGPNLAVEFFDDWTDGGYDCSSELLLRKLLKAAQHGFFVDPTYSGKAWRGLINLVKSGSIDRGSKVLFWHTGGLMNILSCDWTLPNLAR